MEGVRGVSFTSDVAIDNIAFRNGSCERLGMYTIFITAFLKYHNKLTLKGGSTHKTYFKRHL